MIPDDWNTPNLHDCLGLLAGMGKKVAGPELIGEPQLVLALGGLVVLTGAALEELDSSAGEAGRPDVMSRFRAVASAPVLSRWSAARAWLSDLLHDVDSAYAGRDEATLVSALMGIPPWVGVARSIWKVSERDLAVGIGEAESRLCGALLRVVAERG